MMLGVFAALAWPCIGVSDAKAYVYVIEREPTRRDRRRTHVRDLSYIRHSRRSRRRKEKL